MLAYILYKESMAGAFSAPEPIIDNASIVDPSTSYFPLNISFLDMSYSQRWDVTNQPQPAYKVSDLFLLLPGLGVIIGYTLTCIRLRSLERDSRNVNGDETFTTMQLSYYIYCVYWLIGSMICILILGVLYEFRLVHPEYFPVLAQAVKDFQ
ncbi:hypothetical protein BGZ98_010305, partial [Dissophora globulifera]